ncbi:glycerol-3-phosphate 1-O-acyltransferase PlsY [Lachnospiraceae bacterium LCP25S3_G4]
MERIISIAIGYLLGMIQTGYIYGKINHIDIRQYGSGNAGTTNALRTLGWKAGVITFVGDCFKCILAVIVVRMIFKSSHIVSLDLLCLYAGFGAVLGHNFPFYLKFKGGKGIAATAGILLAVKPWMAIIPIIVFIIIVICTKYVSVGSIALVILFFIEMVLCGQFGRLQGTQAELYEIYVISAILMILAIYKHKANIRRLLNGTENKLNLKKNDKCS